jgi:soluble lytic murein transglycosylase
MTRTLFASIALALSMACSADRRGHAPANVATPLTLESHAGPGEKSTTLAPISATSLGIEAFSPLLALSALSGAASALEAGDTARAAREVEAVIARQPPDPSSVQTFQYLLARLREEAGDLSGAAASYDLGALAAGSLGGYANLGASRTLLRNGQAKAALERLGRVPLDGPLGAEALLATAEAAAIVQQPDLAVTSLRRYLEGWPASAEATLAMLRLSELLVDGSRLPALSFGQRASLGREALALERRAMSRAPTDVALAARARTVEMAALVLLPGPERTERTRPDLGDELERLRTLVDGKQYDAARQAADAILLALGEKRRGSEIGCETELLRARALAALREWGKGADELGDVARRCTDRDLRARALFLAGKYAEADKRLPLAVRYYEALEHELPEHRLADDARLRAAETYYDMGAEGRFTELLTRMPDDYPDGDMVLDGMFVLALRRVEKGDWAAATSVLERAASIAAPLDAKRGSEFAGRERYFRARAWAAMGETERSLTEYEAMVRDLPLSYYMLHAYSRLADTDAARAARVLAAAVERAEAAPFAFERVPELEGPGFRRALELLRASDIERAKRELDALGLEKPDARPAILWSVALVYARAGASKLSNDVARGLLTDWLVRWPSGDWQRAWEIAFPRPYHDLVEREAKKSGVPEYLVYAVMREESSFDPAAESPAKAYGLMQLIVPTARQFAKGLGLRPDAESLKRPSVNVGIGCRVLSELTRSFSENPLLAVPGYNAGAGRPRRWLGERPAIDFDVWVELIPYLETRRYTKRVLASRAAYAFLYSPSEASVAMRMPTRLVAR